jgi:DnaJ-class molecular chaperone
MTEENDLLTYVQCPNCLGYGAKGNYPKRVTCPTCKGKGVVAINGQTGKLIIDDENDQSTIY